MNKVVEVDMVVEELWQEVKNGLAKYLRTSERVSRTILWILLGSADSLVYPEMIQINIIAYSLVFIVAERFLQSQKRTHNGAMSMDFNTISIVITRIMVLSCACIATTSWNVGPAFYGAYWYLAVNIHNSGGKSIQDMVKNAVGNMKKRFQKAH